MSRDLGQHSASFEAVLPWSRDGRLLYYLPTTPSLDIRNRVAARRFDPSTGLVDGDAFDVLTLSEMIVPAAITAVAPIAAPDQIIFVLGDYRGDVWMMDIDTPNTWRE